MKTAIQFIVLAAFVAAFCVCGYELYKISDQYVQEAQVKDELMKYRPETTATNNYQGATDLQTGLYPPGQPVDLPAVPDAGHVAEPDRRDPPAIINQSIVDLQNDVNGDIIGWLTIPHTQIDYPFVITGDNDFYMYRNVYGSTAASGSLFMDYRCSPDFSGVNTVIYGHNMRNRSMFGDLRQFADAGFFDANTTGTLFISDYTYTLKIFAYMVVSSEDRLIYDPSPDRAEFFDRVAAYARQYREPDATGNIVTLSTCAYEYDGARMVLLATIS